MAILRFLIQASRRQLAVAVFASVLSGFSSAALVALINQALRAEQAQLSRLGAGFALVSLVGWIARWVSQRVFVRLSQDTLARLRLHISRQLLEAPLRDLESHGAPRLFGLLTEDVHTVSEIFVTLPILVMHGAVVLGCWIYLGSLSLPIFALALGVTAAGAYAYYRSHVKALDYLRRARHEQDGLFQHFRALYAGAKELKLDVRRRRAFLQDLLGHSVDSVRRTYTRGLTIYAASESWGSCLLFLFIGSVLFVFGPMLSAETAVLSGYALVFLHMLMPMEALLLAVPNLNRGRIALERIHAIAGPPAGDGARSPSNAFREGADTPARLHSLRLRGVTHRYQRDQEDGVFMIGPIDLTLGPGELVFLVGGNGSGKTTLAKLLVGLYAPEGGEIVWDGELVTEQTRDAYRQCFSAVFSDFYLFESLVGFEGADLDERAQRWLRALQLDHKVTVHHGTFSTTQLSQGQRKRLALLVAYLEDRPFYVFDEWAADQDPAFKEVFYRRLLPELKRLGKTVLVISHDDRYFDLADRCLKLEYGQLVTGEGGDASRSPMRALADAT